MARTSRTSSARDRAHSNVLAQAQPGDWAKVRMLQYGLDLPTRTLSLP